MGSSTRHSCHVACFEWIDGGQFLRDRHTVTGGPSPYGGEGDAFALPGGSYSDGKQQQAYRSTWRRDGNDAYFVLTEVKAPQG